EVLPDGTPDRLPVIEVVRLLEAQAAEIDRALLAVTERAGERAVFPLELFDLDTWTLRPLAAALNLRQHADPQVVRFAARLVVLLIEMSQPATVAVTAERLGSTAVGGLLALAFALFFWPSWERHSYPRILAEALRANRAYLRAVAARLTAGGPYSPDDVRAKQ